MILNVECHIISIFALTKSHIWGPVELLYWTKFEIFSTKDAKDNFIRGEIWSDTEKIRKKLKKLRKLRKKEFWNFYEFYSIWGEKTILVKSS